MLDGSAINPKKYITWAELIRFFAEGNAARALGVAVGPVGPTGPAGNDGANGTNGAQGDKGGLRYNFSTTTTDSDPGQGVVRFNNATIGSVTFLYFDNLTVEGADVGASYLATWGAGAASPRGTLIIKSNTNGDATVCIFSVTGAVTDGTGYRKVPVTYVSGALPSNGEACVVEFIFKGDPCGPTSVTVLTSGTSATYTVPAGITRIKARVQGAGGGGGGADQAAAAVGSASGGCCGAYAEKRHTVVAGQTFTYTIGALGGGGTAGNNAGTAGGDTKWDEGGTVVTAPGGPGGSSMANGTTVAATGFTAAMSNATNGDVNVPTCPGGRGWRFSVTIIFAGNGADGKLGSGGIAGISSATPPTAGLGYGAGGGGANAFSGTADVAGADGAPGVIIVEEYS